MPSCFLACGFNVPAAITIRSRRGASAITTVSRPSSRRSHASRAIEADEQRISATRGAATATNPKTGESLSPTGLGAAPSDVSPERDPREALVDWMAAPDNPFFARSLVNRYWKHFFSRGIVDPEDDMRVTNPASNPRTARRPGASISSAVIST